MIGGRKKFKEAKNFILYYGSGKEGELSKYDVAVVEPLGQSVKSLETMHEAQTMVIAYVSVMEIIKDFPLFKLLKDEDFLKLNESRLMNNDYQTYLLDLRSKRWSSLLTQHIGNLVVNENYDGVFLDTLGDMEWHILPEYLKKELFFALRTFLTNFRSIFGETIIIQNNGVHQVINYTFDLVDGLCWENPSLEGAGKAQWVDETISKLKMLSKEESVKIMLLYEQGRQNSPEAGYVEKAEAIAKSNNFLFYSTDKYV